MSESHIDVSALYGERKASFSIWDRAKYLMLAQEDGYYREGIQNRGVKALGSLLHGPFPGGALQPSISFQPLSLYCSA